MKLSYCSFLNISCLLELIVLKCINSICSLESKLFSYLNVPLKFVLENEISSKNRCSIIPTLMWFFSHNPFLFSPYQRLCQIGRGVDPEQVFNMSKYPAFELNKCLSPYKSDTLLSQVLFFNNFWFFIIFENFWIFLIFEKKFYLFF